MATRPIPRPSTLLLTLIYLIFTIGHAYSDNSGNKAPPPPRPPAAPQSPQGDGSGGNAQASSAVYKARNLHNIFPDIDGNGTLFIPDIESYSNAQLYALLIDILEKLDVLVPRTPSCYQLQKIVHEVLPAAGSSGSNSHDSGSGATSGSGSTSIGVYLYFSETPLTSAEVPPSVRQGNGSAVESANGSDVTSQKVAPPVKANNGCVASEPDFVVSMDAQPLLRDGVMNDTHGLRVDDPGGSVNGSGGAGAGRHTGANGRVYHISGNGDEEKGDSFGGE